MSKVKNIDHWKTQLQMYEHMPDQIMSMNNWTEKQLIKETADLEEKIILSQRGKSSRRKGASYENTVAKIIGEKWGIRLVRTPMSGGFQKTSDNTRIRGDLSLLDEDKHFLLHPECKNQKTWQLRSWFKQAESDCPEGKIPIVIFHEFQKNVDGKREVEADDFVQIRLTDFLDIVDKDKVIIQSEGKDINELRKTSKRIRRVKKPLRRKKV